MSQNVFFALIGYFIEHILEYGHYNRKAVIIGAVLSFVALAITCFMTYYHANKVGVCTTEQQEAFFNSFICIPAMYVYFLVKTLSARVCNQRIQNVASVLGAAVFGVYLIEKFIRAFISGIYVLLYPIVGSFIASLVWCLVVCCVGFVIVISLKHTPGIKKLVNRFI